MKHAVILIAGKQYLCHEGEVVNVEKLTDNPDHKVLLVCDADKVEIGKPYLDEKLVKIKILDKVLLDKKINILKYKAKSRYRKRIGFRRKYSRIQIEKIV